MTGSSRNERRSRNANAQPRDFGCWRCLRLRADDEVKLHQKKCGVAGCSEQEGGVIT